MVQLGQHPAPSHTVVHLSDTHLLDGGVQLYGRVDSTVRLISALERLEHSGIQPDAIVVTGDLVDLGEAAAYRRLRSLVEPVAARLGAEIVWCMGNHDERAPYARELFDEPEHTGDGSHGIAPQDRVVDVHGLRIIALDTTVPGYHHGALDPEQLDWLRARLAEPAEHGTLLALHHPPMPSPLTEAMAILELDDQDALATVLVGTDVRGILAGHLHYSAHSTLAGIPVSVASASCYTLALGVPDRILAGVDRHQAFDVLHVYPDRVVHTTVPVDTAELVSGHPAEALERIAAIPPELRRELFSRKDSAFQAAALLADPVATATVAEAAVAAALTEAATRASHPEDRG
ncbi:MAG TPA: metallophosphoesterase [Microbacteriaceae bacterium]|nr:metallophosphoesterase [Microbacteriaceae bacterium]